MGKTKLIFLSLGKAAKKKKKILVVFIGLLRFIPYFFSKAEENKKSSWPKFCKVIIIIFLLALVKKFCKGETCKHHQVSYSFIVSLSPYWLLTWRIQWVKDHAKPIGGQTNFSVKLLRLNQYRKLQSLHLICICSKKDEMVYMKKKRIKLFSIFGYKIAWK